MAGTQSVPFRMYSEYKDGPNCTAEKLPPSDMEESPSIIYCCLRFCTGGQFSGPSKTSPKTESWKTVSLNYKDKCKLTLASLGHGAEKKKKNNLNSSIKSFG